MERTHFINFGPVDESSVEDKDDYDNDDENIFQGPI